MPWKEKSNSVQYDLLFKEDDQYEPGPFLQMLRTQYLQERQEFLTELERHLRGCSKTSSPTAEHYRTALTHTDHALAEDEMKRLIKAGMGKGDGVSSTGVPVADFLRNLRKVVFRFVNPYTVRVLGVEIRM